MKLTVNVIYNFRSIAFIGYVVFISGKLVYRARNRNRLGFGVLGGLKFRHQPTHTLLNLARAKVARASGGDKCPEGFKKERQVMIYGIYAMDSISTFRSLTSRETSTQALAGGSSPKYSP